MTRKLTTFYKTEEGQKLAAAVRPALQYHPHGPVLLWGYGAPYVEENVTLQFKDTAGEKRLPYGDAAFAQVVLIHLLEQAPDPAAVIQEATRMLQGQGVLTVVIPQEDDIGQPFAVEDLKGLLEAVGLTQLSTQGIGGTGLPQTLDAWYGRVWPQGGKVVVSHSCKRVLGGLKLPSAGEIGKKVGQVVPLKPAGACRSR